MHSTYWAKKLCSSIENKLDCETRQGKEEEEDGRTYSEQRKCLSTTSTTITYFLKPRLKVTNFPSTHKQNADYSCINMSKVIPLAC